MAAYIRRRVRPGVVDHASQQVVDSGMSERVVERTPFSWAQAVAFVIGPLFIIFGAVALARTGLPSGSFTQPHVSVGGFDHTPLFALIELTFGLLVVVAGATRGKAGLAFLGGLAMVFGFITLIEPTPFHDALGVHANTSWLYIVVGLVLLLTGLLAPTVYGGDRVVLRTRQAVVADDVVAAPPVVEEQVLPPRI